MLIPPFEVPVPTVPADPLKHSKQDLCSSSLQYLQKKTWRELGVRAKRINSGEGEGKKNKSLLSYFEF